jgi:arginyl-tRNA synthetase
MRADSSMSGQLASPGVMNLLDQLARVVQSIDSDFSVLPVYRAAAKGDARVVYYPADPERANKVTAALEALEEEPNITVTARREASLTVRFTDEQVAQLGTMLELGEHGAVGASDLMADDDVLVNFCDANPTKALHVGHLRNIALGNALASTLEAGGADVTRQSQVSDYCRSMGEALAGHLEKPDDTPARLRLKSDHFVGGCYVRYARRVELSPDRSDPVLEQEGLARDDAAEQVLAQWVNRDQSVLRSWEQLREWALEGHRQTLRRLGVEFDSFLYESNYVDVVKQILDAGLEKRLFTRTTSGDIVYETGDEHYPQLLLARADGFPTQHLRTMALWQTVGATLHGICSIELVGDEWQSYVRHHKNVMELLQPLGNERHPTHNLMYGMVRLAGHTVKSRDGAPPLVDDVLDQLSTSDEVRELALEGEGRVDAADIVSIVALGGYLVHPRRKPIDLAHAKNDEGQGLEWAMARAFVNAWNERYDGPPDPAPGSANYRDLVLQSQVHKQLVAGALQRYEVRDLARFHGHLSKQYLATKRSERQARVMRTVLGAGLRALGLIKPLTPR